MDTPLVPIPSHIPEHLVFDYDHMADSRLLPDPHEGAASVAASAPPIFFTPRYCGHWVVTGYQEVTDIARDSTTFSTRRYNLFGLEQDVKVFPMMLDGEEHTRFRMPLAKAFSPAALDYLKPDVRAHARALLQEVRDLGRCDFLRMVAEPLPMKIFMRLVGMPLEMFDQFREWVVTFFRTTDLEERNGIYQSVWNSMTQAIDDRMRSRQNDVISLLIDTDVGDRKPTREELQLYCMQLFFGGLDTLVNGISFAITRLARDQELQSRLRAEPSLLHDAADELLRLYGVVTPLRIVTKDCDYHGVPFREGDMVMLHLPAANRDPRQFKCPAHFELGRKSPHLTFNAGPHRCVGAWLSRVELIILLEEMLTLLPPFRLDADQPAEAHAGIVYAMDRLPLVWDV